MICDEVREQPDGIDDEGETDELDLDPRVEGELDNLNKASNDINILEKELDEARAVFRQRLTDAARSLKQLAKSLGNSIDKARPYFEALNQSKKAQLECQNAAMTYERACQDHKGARDTISVAEDKLMYNPAMFDQAWQEMLNTANTKLMEAEKEKLKNENMHLEAALAYRELETRATQLERQLKKSVNKARPYFEQRTIYLGCLEAQKARVQELEIAYLDAKAQYSRSLRNLESISEDIHRQRSKNSSTLSTPTATRQEGVGAELTDTMESVRRRLHSEETVQKTLEEHHKIETQKPHVPNGRYRSSLVLDLDMDIDLVESIDPAPPKRASAKNTETTSVNVTHFDDYQVLDIMPFLEKEKQRKRSMKSVVERNTINEEESKEGTLPKQEINTQRTRTIEDRSVSQSSCDLNNQTKSSIAPQKELPLLVDGCSTNVELDEPSLKIDQVNNPESIDLSNLRVDGNGRSNSQEDISTEGAGDVGSVS